MNPLVARLALIWQNARAREAVPAPTLDAAAARDAAGLTGFGGEIALYPLPRGACGGCALELRGLFAPQAAAARLGFRLCTAPEEADVLLLIGAAEAATDAAVIAAMARAPQAVVVALGDCAMLDAAASPVIAVPGCPPEPRAILGTLAALKRP